MRRGGKPLLEADKTRDAGCGKLCQTTLSKTPPAGCTGNDIEATNGTVMVEGDRVVILE